MKMCTFFTQISWYLSLFVLGNHISCRYIRMKGTVFDARSRESTTRLPCCTFFKNTSEDTCSWHLLDSSSSPQPLSFHRLPVWSLQDSAAGSYTSSFGGPFPSPSHSLESFSPLSGVFSAHIVVVPTVRLSTFGADESHTTVGNTGYMQLKAGVWKFG